VRGDLQENIPSSEARAERLLDACSLALELEDLSRMLILRIHISKIPVDISMC
jgi:hypothetical protein